jgi:hypothetical protein
MEKRIYVIVAATIQVPVVPGSHKPPLRTVFQPHGRQIAQACHVVSLLRHAQKPMNFHLDAVLSASNKFEPITTIILQARDSAEMGHTFSLLHRKRLNPVVFSDENPEYGPGPWPTAIAVFAAPDQIRGAIDYLPLWGAQ